MIKKMSVHRMAAAVTAGMLVAESGTANATATTFATVGSNIMTSAGNLPQMISTVAYVGGIGLGVAGVFKLKQHVDNPGQTPMKDGLVRLGSGGGLLALPYVTQAMVGSISNGPAGTAASAFTIAAPPTAG